MLKHDDDRDEDEKPIDRHGNDYFSAAVPQPLELFVRQRTDQPQMVWLKRLKRIELILWLPPTTESAVELHHRIDLVPASAREN